jgi:hypothetical protein
MQTTSEIRAALLVVRSGLSCLAPAVLVIESTPPGTDPVRTNIDLLREYNRLREQLTPLASELGRRLYADHARD